MKSIKTKVYNDKDELGYEAARLFAELATRYIIQYETFNVALSGGSTPKLLFHNLIKYYKNTLDWNKINFFWSDERYVPLDDPESNAGMAFTELFDPLEQEDLNIYPVDTSLSPSEEAAEAYERLILSIHPPLQPVPRFDLILLGMGDDGHTASLFPETEALHENSKLISANWVPKFEKWRITFTFPLINSAKNVIFLVSGANKAEIVRDIFNNSKDYPAAQVSPVEGVLTWLLDKEAGKYLKNQ